MMATTITLCSAFPATLIGLLLSELIAMVVALICGKYCQFLQCVQGAGIVSSTNKVSQNYGDVVRTAGRKREVDQILTGGLR
jgi:hypothetical protein